MKRPLSRGIRRLPAARLGSEAGVTFVELLAALMAAGIGLLAILAIFPLGALEMARAIKDDRTAAVAAQARDLSETGEALLARTMGFVQVSMSKGSADPDQAGKLREEYEQLARESVEMEIALTQSPVRPSTHSAAAISEPVADADPVHRAAHRPDDSAPVARGGRPADAMSYSGSRSLGRRRSRSAASPVASFQPRTRACATISRSKGSRVQPTSAACANQAPARGSSSCQRGSARTPLSDRPSTSVRRPTSTRS